MSLVISVLTVVLGYSTLGLAAQSVGSEPLNSLPSANWRVRAQSIERLARNPGALRSPTTRTLLVALLDRETRLVQDRASNEAKGGEGYGEYYSRLLGIVDSLVDSRDASSVGVLVR